MTILRLCDKESAAVPPETPVAEAIRLMLARRVGAVVVVDANRVVGIFTERDVLKKLALSGRDPEKVPVRELMTPCLPCWNIISAICRWWIPRAGCGASSRFAICCTSRWRN